MAQLPERFRPCFWDTDFDGLDVRENRAFIIARLYTKGGFEGMLAVAELYSDEDVICAARTRRDLDPIVANYLRKRYGIKKEDMNYYRMRSVRMELRLSVSTAGGPVMWFWRAYR